MGISPMTPTEYAQHRLDVQRYQGRTLTEDEELWAELSAGQHAVCDDELTLTHAITLLRPMLNDKGQLWPRCAAAEVLVKAAIHMLVEARTALLDFHVHDVHEADED